MNRDKKRRQKEGKGRRGWLSKGTGKREFYYIEEGSHCEGERMWGFFLVHGNEKSAFLKEGEDCVNRTDGEGEDFSFFWKRRRRGCRQHSRTHCVALSRQQGAHYSTACRMNRRLSVQQPFRQDGPAERGWRCQSDAVLIWVPLLQVWLRLEMSTMVLGVRKRRHCERGEKGQTAPRVTLPLRSLCILRCRVLVSGFRASVLMKHNEWKIPKRMCGREVKLAVRDVTMVSLFPLYPPKNGWVVFNTAVSAGAVPLSQQIMLRWCWYRQRKPFGVFVFLPQGLRSLIWVEKQNLLPLILIKCALSSNCWETDGF